MPLRNIKQGDGKTSAELLRHRLWTLNTLNDWAPISHIAFCFSFFSKHGEQNVSSAC